MLVLGLGAPAAAHEHGHLPIRKAGSRQMVVVPIVAQSSHVDSAIAFGEIPYGVATSRAFALSNRTARVITCDITAPAGLSVSPTHLVLQPAGGAGSSASVTVTITPNSGGAYSSSLTMSVAHDGVPGPGLESIPVSATVPPPAALKISVPQWGLYDVDEIEVGLVADQEYYLPDEAPSLVVKVENVSSSVAEGVSLTPAGAGGDLGGEWGTCSFSAPALCVSPSSLGDIPAGGYVMATVRFLPAGGVGEFSARLNAVGRQVELRSVDVIGEVIPFALPNGKDFLRPGGVLAKATASEEGFGESTDPLGNDPLGQLRVTSFDARTMFSIGDMDSVDLRAGNLTLVIPIGGAIPVRGPLSYALQAVYNSDLWYRKTMGKYEVEVNGRFKAKPLDGEWVNPLFNLRGGWSFHLGRLLPPRPYDGADFQTLCQSADPLDFEDEADTGQRFVYVDPSGTQHELWRTLHGEEFVPGQAPVGQEGLGELYTRDGSYLRLVRESDTVRWIEEPGGLRRRFVKQTTLKPSLPDRWLLDRIEDRYGNRAEITYGTDNGQQAWFIGDGEAAGGSDWRQVIVTFQSWTGREADEPMIVDEVRLPGFDGGAARVYSFEYSNLTLDRERGPFYSNAQSYCPELDTTVKVPRLDRIVQPDGTAWSFNYTTAWLSTTDDLRMTSVDLPTGGSIAYEYEKVWDANPGCGGNNYSRIHPGVTRRVERDVGGAQLAERRYLRQYRRDDIPAGICSLHKFGDATPFRPLSQQVVAVWEDQQSDLSTVTKHYFNIWPYDDRCKAGLAGCVDINAGVAGASPDWRLASRRTHVERNAPIDPSQRDVDGLPLSSETYSCPWSISGGPTVAFVQQSQDENFEGDDLADLIDHDGTDEGTAADCVLKEATRKKIEAELAGNCLDGYPSCVRDWRPVTEKVLHHEDGGAWSRVDRSDYDGLGHYRRSVLDASWDTPQSDFTNYNPSVGTLVLSADHRVTTNVTPPSTWLLETYAEHWVKEGSVYRGGEAYFDPDLGHMKYDRTWRCLDSESYDCRMAETDLSKTRTGSDLVVKYVVNDEGELVRQRFFGADTYGSAPLDDQWWNDANWGGSDEETWANTRQDYALAFEYSYGVPSKRFVMGDSVDELDVVIDQATGWTKTQRLNSGEVVDHLYDAMGRVTWLSSGTTATRRFQYTKPTATAGWTLTAKVYPRTVTPTTTDPGSYLIRSYTVHYDGLGRFASETVPTWDSSASRFVSYHPSGGIRRVTSLDAASKAWTFSYDYAGRRTSATQPDGRERVFFYSGARVLRQVSCVKTGGTTDSGICNGTGFERAEAKLERDGKGRTAKITSADGVVTTFTYDPDGNQTSAQRKQGAITQTRTWTYDGLGFRRSESIPERSGLTTSYSNFTTRGLFRSVTEGSRVRTLAYDRLGRLRSLSVYGQAVKTFLFCDPAAAVAQRCSTATSANGQLLEAIRYNNRNLVTSGTGEAGSWEVKSTFSYDSAGRRSNRLTGVRWNPTVGTTTAWTEFTQGWGYDDLGNVTSRNYPRCTKDGAVWDCEDDALTVSTSYRKGFYLRSVDVASAPVLDADLTYHKSGLVNTVVHAAGGGTDEYGLEMDGTGAVLGMPRIGSMHLAMGTGNALNLGNVSYDGVGNITAIGTDTFQYDLDSRLTQAVLGGSTYTYDYDNFDNIVNGAGGTIDQTTNRLKVTATNGYGYDAFGNLIKARVTPGGVQYDIRLIYDELDKLTYLYNDPTAAPGVAQLSIYDHDDLRILQQPLGGTAEEVRWTLRDGLQVVRELVGLASGIRTAKDYVYAGSRLISSREYPGTDYPAGNVRHYHADQVGSTRVITGFGAGKPEYAPFGPALVASGEATVGFQGHETDGLTTYMRGRTYLPTGGRFLQVDPQRDDWNAYAFAANNPINAVDPDGQAVWYISRELGGIETRQVGNPWSHSYIAITDSEGNVVSTYSWGNNGNPGFWHQGVESDNKTAQEAIDAGLAEPLGDDTLDAWIADAFEREFKDDSPHFNGGITYNCKWEAKCLVTRAKENRRGAMEENKESEDRWVREQKKEQKRRKQAEKERQKKLEEWRDQQAKDFQQYLSDRNVSSWQELLGRY